MRPLTLATALFVLAACSGAVVANPGDLTEPQAGGRTQDPATRTREVYAKRAVDKRRVRELEPVRARADTGQRAFEHVERIVSFGPRYSLDAVGRPGWARQLDYIEEELERLGLTVVRDTWTDEKEQVTFANLTATIPGRRKERILLGCHHDTKRTTGHPDPEHNFDFDGANDGGSAVGLLLALAPTLVERKSEATLELVFFDGEESLDWRWNDAARALFGSKRFVRRHRDAVLLGEEAPIAALILLDMVGRRDLHIQDELYSTTELREILWSAAVACGHRDHFFRRAEAAADDHYPFLEVGIPAVDVIDLNGNPHWHTPHDTLENISAESLQKVADVVLTMLPEVERAYVADDR